ncbi:MAG: carboxypeptidase-like regulatory domain-containing protein [Gemmataceae bacterium]|nr:carboxypeptidase-like regulatory domain-containing protein [Gemmataceae bacterium]
MGGRLNGWLRGAAVLALIGAAGGCGGGGTSKVHGKVTYQGKTVVWGSVSLIDTNGNYHQGDIDLNGNYTIEKVPVGPVKVTVASPNPDRGAGRGGAGKGVTGGKAGENPDDPRDKWLAEQGKSKTAEERPRPAAGTWFPLDARYNDPGTSGLTGEVKRGDTELNIDIK